MSRRLALVALALAGCASTSPKDDYADVAGRVEARGGTAVHWDQQSPEDAQVDTRVREILARDLTSDGAVEVALLRNRKMQQVYESVAVAQADLVQAGLLANPSLSAHVGIPLGSGGTELAGSLTENFLSLFTIPLRQRFAERELEAAKLRVGAAVLDLAADVRAAFLRLQGAQQAAELWRAIAESESASSDLAQGQFKAGNISELELVSREAAYEQDRLDLARAENEVLERREELTRLLGVWGPEAGWKVSASLQEIPASDPQLEHLEAAAVEKRLDLAAARAETDSVAQSLALASGTRLFTNLEVAVEGDRDPEGAKVIGPRVNLELPVFDQHQAQLAKLESQLRQARARQDELAIDIRSEVRTARSHLVAARAVAEHYRRVLVPLRQRIVKLSQEHYDAMLLGVYGLLQAKQSEVAGYRDYLDAVRDYWLARIEVERALGARIPATITPSTAADVPPGDSILATFRSTP